jgi:basic membrane protein A
VKRTARSAAALVGVAALTLAACGDRDESSSSSDPSPSESASSSEPAQSNPDFKACIVSDSGGFNDKSFNQTSYAGLQNAAEKLGVETGEVESNSPSEFADNIDAMVQEDCNSITTVGFLLGDATLAAAKKNPKIDFSIVDFAYEKAPKNLKGLVFNTAEPSFLAGYLAAGTSESGIVGTLGGAQIPSVTAFMDGFQSGIEKYNEDEGTDVQLIGWDKETQKGTFTNDFESKTKGQSAASEMITQGADIIFPVAGPAGLGALQAVQDNDLKAIWVDTDGCVSAAEYCDVLLTSVMKGMDVAVYESIKASLEGTFTNDFEAKTKGQSAASEMITQGADIIFPVAGPAGLGALQAAQDADVKAIWVDTDGCVSAAEYCDVLLTSVMKGMDVAVQEAITASVDGNFSSEQYVGDAANGGVDYAEGHDAASAITPEIKAKVDEVKQGLADGTIQTNVEVQ